MRRTAQICRVALIALLFTVLVSSTAQAASTCWEQTTTNCCQQVKAPLTVDCEINGKGWTCGASGIVNPVINTVRKADNGFEGFVPEQNGERHCTFKKPKCGATYKSCGTQSLETKLVCEAKVVNGNACRTPQELLSSGDGQWDLNFALAVDGQPYEFSLGGRTCGGGEPGTELVP